MTNHSTNKVILATLLITSAPLLLAQGMGGATRPDFSFFDSDSDGQLTREELTNSVPDPGVVDRILMLDTNSDGVVSKQEYENPPQ